ncbi:MAG: hypothetical protein J2P21_27855 [Chloracidobacterium sp.]|nr:hypothetical protein [Chloracidobacterium sp.]
MDKSKQHTARALQHRLGDEDQEEKGGGHWRTLIRVIDRVGSNISSMLSSPKTSAR